mmetsp:Transcript_29647/g.63063  ORF Transcript_29647/g.63063 Transcript_29647/m.63063 type:complete len:213 (-) Transcript_29647:2522-3160(-)
MSCTCVTTCWKSSGMLPLPASLPASDSISLAVLDIKPGLAAPFMAIKEPCATSSLDLDLDPLLLHRLLKQRCSLVAATCALRSTVGKLLHGSPAKGFLSMCVFLLSIFCNFKRDLGSIFFSVSSRSFNVLSMSRELPFAKQQNRRTCLVPFKKVTEPSSLTCSSKAFAAFMGIRAMSEMPVGNSWSCPLACSTSLMNCIACWKLMAIVWSGS